LKILQLINNTNNNRKNVKIDNNGNNIININNNIIKDKIKNSNSTHENTKNNIMIIIDNNMTNNNTSNNINDNIKNNIDISITNKNIINNIINDTNFNEEKDNSIKNKEIMALKKDLTPFTIRDYFTQQIDKYSNELKKDSIIRRFKDPAIKIKRNILLNISKKYFPIVNVIC
jgi:hypothetical protein